MAKKLVPRFRQARLDAAARKGRTITLSEVQRETGVSISTLRRLEGGSAAGIEFETLRKLAEFYGLSDLSDLLGLEDGWAALRAAVA